MRSPYSIYNEYYQHVLEIINSKCGLKKPTSIPPPLVSKPDAKPPFCATARFYTTIKGDTCSSISGAKNISSSSLWLANSNILSNCSNIAAGQRLCLPHSCSKTYTVKPGDSCDLIELRGDLWYGTLRKYNAWLNADCSNLQSGIKNMGNVLCITATAVEDLNLTPPKGATQPGNGLRNN
jgi:hypothetical protein